MKLHRFPCLIASCLLFLLGILCLSTPLKAGQFEEDVSSENYLFAKGIIRSISLDTQTITIKVKKGPPIVLLISQDTLFEGFYKLEELQPRDTIKVWYQPGPQENKVLKLLKPLALGC